MTSAEFTRGAATTRRRLAPLIDEPPAIDWTAEEQIPVGVL